ncbi:Rhodanese-like domain-containing protein [Kalaharituber pfeilii]|nr:Rhodanese-like domain-containing protein [Kalaharituber pfeilii]
MATTNVNPTTTGPPAPAPGPTSVSTSTFNAPQEVSPPTAEQPWHTLFPKPTSTPPAMDRETLLELLKASDGSRTPPPLLVDVRRTDFAGGTIRGAINLPAQSFWWVREGAYRVAVACALAAARDKESRTTPAVKVVIWCGSSAGRAPRAAGWLLDYISERRGQATKEAGDNDDVNIEVYTLAGGIRGWAEAGGEYLQWMEGYEAEWWATGGKGCQ